MIHWPMQSGDYGSFSVSVGLALAILIRLTPIVKKIVRRITIVLGTITLKSTGT